MNSKEGSENDLEKAYVEASKSQWIRLSKVAATLALVLVPAGISLDLFIYPENFIPFLIIRLSVDAVILAAVLFCATEIGKKHIKSITFAWFILIQSMISYMIYATEGSNSTYYAGLNLAVLGLGIVLPTKPIETVLFCSSTILIYLLACFGNTSTEIDPQTLYNNIYFLVLTGIIITVSTYFIAQRRFEEFRLSYELNKTNVELSKLDRLKSQFFANVSHELRTPLTLILSPVQDLVKRADELPPQARETLRMVQANAFRLLRLVNDLLDVIRLEEGSEKLAREPVDLNRVASGMAEGIAHLAESKGVRLERELEGAALVVAGDVGALEKIVLNLLNNAVKFTEEGGWVRLATRREGSLATVEVSDSGIGIPTTELPHIFDRFRQADGSSTRRHRGTGLGLSLVKELTEKMGGTVRAESTPGVGTTLRVELPLSNEEPRTELAAPFAGRQDALEALHRQAALFDGPSPTAVSAAAHEIDDGTAAGDDRPLLLVVDDEPDMRRYLRQALAARYRVVEAEDGESGLRLALRTRPTLILLDLMLPGINGFEVTRRLRVEESLRNTRIILLTARDSEETKLRALEEGADDFVPKPFLIPELEARVRNLIDRSRLFEEVEATNRQLSATLRELHDTEAHLIQSEKINALGSLAAGLLHEINNPLNFSMMALQVARGEPVVEENSDLREVLDDIQEGMSRIHAIVRDLNTFAHPSAGDLEGRFALRDAINSALQFTAHEVKELDVELAVDEACVAAGSRSHIVQVLINLITNAAKAVKAADRDKDVRKILISCKQSNSRLEVSVWDNGVGIPKEILPRIFDPFFTTRDVGEGMGMGLSICHTIVRNHHGTLRVESSEGEWTRFSFDLPVN